MSKGHTKGPWEFIPGGNRPFVQQVGAFPAGFICNVESLNFVADARLIAAAPDLLAALKALDANGHTQATWENALRAIAKAEGRS